MAAIPTKNHFIRNQKVRRMNGTTAATQLSADLALRNCSEVDLGARTAEEAAGATAAESKTLKCRCRVPRDIECDGHRWPALSVGRASFLSSPLVPGQNCTGAPEQVDDRLGREA